VGNVLVCDLKHLFQAGREHKPLQAHSLVVPPAGRLRKESNVRVPFVGRFEFGADVLDLFDRLLYGLKRKVQLCGFVPPFMQLLL